LNERNSKNLIKDNVDKVVYDRGQAQRIRAKVYEKENKEKTM